MIHVIAFIVPLARPKNKAKQQILSLLEAFETYDLVLRWIISSDDFAQLGEHGTEIFAIKTHKATGGISTTIIKERN